MDAGQVAVERLRAVAVEVRRLAPRVEARRPWPLVSVDHDAAPESAWGPPEILAHVAEMLPFWLGEIERILDGSPEPVPFGRTVEDRSRVLTIERDRTLPPRELVARIDAAVERYARRLPQLTPADLGRRGLHPTRGEMTVAELLARFVVDHADDHAEQLLAALGAAGAATGGADPAGA